MRSMLLCAFVFFFGCCGDDDDDDDDGDGDDEVNNELLDSELVVDSSASINLGLLNLFRIGW
jgi:hypothetical protein